ncbi:MAG: hypothetical protein NC395_07305 [Prevotella sp.]|nr:hypothetical protein [Prevotella sp.]
MIKKAIEKLNAENAEFKGDRCAAAMRSDVLKTLINFCGQEKEFAQAVVQNGKTFSDCMKEVAMGCGTSISDLEAYKKAVRFYFPGADIKCVMTVDLIGSAADGTPPIVMTGGKKSVLEISLDDLF